MPRFFVLFSSLVLLAVLSLPAHAERSTPGVYTVLAPMTKDTAINGELAIRATFINVSGGRLEFISPETLTCTVHSTGTDPVAVTLDSRGLAGQDVLLGPGEQVQVLFVLTMPDGVSGDIIIRADGESNAAMVSVSPGAKDRTREMVRNVRENTDAMGYFEKNFSGLDPTYFLMGVDPTDIKFQLSFKYRIFGDKGGLAKLVPGISDIYMGYTQTSVWDIYKDSSPFKDTSYKPGLFYYKRDLGLDLPDWLARLGLQTGYMHESNGQPAPESKSLNQLYIKPIMAFGDEDEYHFVIAPKMYGYILDMSDNPDMHKYRGYVDLEMEWGKHDGFLIEALARKGTAGGKGSIQLDASYPLDKWLMRNLDLFLHVQLFHGYGDTLLTYREKDTRLRIGFSVFR